MPTRTFPQPSGDSAAWARSMPSSDKPPVLARVLWQVTQYCLTVALWAAAVAAGASAAGRIGGFAGACAGEPASTPVQQTAASATAPSPLDTRFTTRPPLFATRNFLRGVMVNSTPARAGSRSKNDIHLAQIGRASCREEGCRLARADV